MTTDQVPDTVADEECLVRNVYTPFHVESKQGGKVLKEAAFIPPKQRESQLFSNEISTLRVSYTNVQFCKEHGRRIASNRDQIGFAVIKVANLRSIEPLACEVKSTKLMEQEPPLPMHADIIYNFTPQSGVPIPHQIKQVFKAIAREHACFYEDPKPESADWQGNDKLTFPCLLCVRCQNRSTSV